MAKLQKLLGKEFPELRERLDFGEFHKELAGNSVDVWLNLSDEFRVQLSEQQALFKEFQKKLEKNERRVKQGHKPHDLSAEWEKVRDTTAEVYSKLWDCSPDEYKQLITLDAALSNWLHTRTWQLINNYEAGRGEAESD